MSDDGSRGADKTSSVFFTLLQDLVFGLFGAITLNVVIFAIFLDAHDDEQEEFVCVTIDWVSADFRRADGTPDPALIQEQIASGVAFQGTGEKVGEGVEWSLKPDARAVATRVSTTEAITTLYFAEVPRDLAGGRWRVERPATAAAVTVRTKSYTRGFSRGEDVVVETKR